MSFSIRDKSCVWEIDQDDSGEFWKPGCDDSGVKDFYFSDGGPFENNFKFCPYCAKPIVELIPSDDDQEDFNG